MDGRNKREGAYLLHNDDNRYIVCVEVDDDDCSSSHATTAVSVTFFFKAQAHTNNAVGYSPKRNAPKGNGL